MNTKWNPLACCRFYSFVVAAYAIAALLISYSAPAQNLFVEEYEQVVTNHKVVTTNNIFEYAPDGLGSTFASGSNYITALAFDSADDLYSADTLGGNIYEIMPNGARITFATGLYEPQGLAFDNAGDLFVTDFGSPNVNTGHIYEFTPGGVKSTFASGLNPGGSGLAIDSTGNLFVTDIENQTIYEFTPQGVQTTFASGLAHPQGLAFNRAGDLFEADFSSGDVYEFTPGGAQSTFASGLSNPYGLAFNSAGNLFVTDFNGGNVYEFTPGGAQSTFASGSPTNHLTALVFQGVPAPPVLVQLTFLGNGAFQFGITNNQGASFTVLTTTNLMSPLTNWTVLGTLTNTGSGQYEFTDPSATNAAPHFYRVRSP
jgi:sugar lactone lactonase YvrE